jgi:hypothetical protein
MLQSQLHTDTHTHMHTQARLLYKIFDKAILPHLMQPDPFVKPNPFSTVRIKVKSSRWFSCFGSMTLRDILAPSAVCKGWILTVLASAFFFWRTYT